MSFVQRDDVIEDLPPATADPALRDPVLPGRLHTRALRLGPVAFRKVITSASKLVSWSRKTY
jgi:hypothetical protein